MDVDEAVLDSKISLISEILLVGEWNNEFPSHGFASTSTKSLAVYLVIFFCATYLIGSPLFSREMFANLTLIHIYISRISGCTINTHHKKSKYIKLRSELESSPIAI